ncbi:GTP-binding protein [Thecamonas trahens ATCC 50062]|uniref:GTP-binding protein n=1 Tax=Thecamonas trahens ATCC 50062 TaxID=461836 RepID=A0A0L0DND6_THETB|nr:GTP-binding protein [Thecamonas trahens ATCC 50062]KNC53770.1 GTP-binding protein [Thecamonas trahens ATCC 50062]|eukprot:XP_013754332.1 GTP-binding protein [Thecamonas trahens ATCC 50062]
MIAAVGKPSAGKSSLLNAVTDAKAKVGAYPFTTIEPNRGMAWIKVDALLELDPRLRSVPVSVLDVAGLVPGAAEGAGLGNKFLDDLRTAQVLVHVVDASGTTDEKGQAARGYDPVGDVEWLFDEIISWVAGNLAAKWPATARRHARTGARMADTLQAQLSGYGTKPALTAELVDTLGLRDSEDLEAWDDERIRDLAAAFVAARFPTILALNKIDHPDADVNIMGIVSKYGDDRVVLCSALAELALRKMAKAKYIEYVPGTDEVLTAADAPDAGLKPLPSKHASTLESIQDLVLFRHGSTGVHEVIAAAVAELGLFPVFPVASAQSCRGFDLARSAGAAGSSGGASSTDGPGLFSDVFMVKPGTTVRTFAINFLRSLYGDDGPGFGHAERPDGTPLSGGHVLTPDDTVLRIVTG